MGRLFDCHIALVPWGERIYFKRAKVGLIRKDNKVYLAIFTNSTASNCKLPINPGFVEFFPASIRFKDLKKDLFIRNVADEQKHKTMMREIKIVLKRESLQINGKKDTFDRFISTIPTINDFHSDDLKPARLSARVAHYPYGNEANATLKQLDDNAFYGSTDANTTRHHPNKQPLPPATQQQYKQFANKHLRKIQIIGLVDLPKEIWLRASLRELTLTECNLTSVPHQLMKFSTTLTCLNLSNNRIARLPRAFCCKMTSLVSLDLSHNQIETLPIEIKFFRSLIDLDVSENRLRMLPSTFSDLKNLRNLNVANNNLSQLPAFRRNEMRLKRLDVSFNPLDGALTQASTFEVYPSGYDGGYEENVFCPMTSTSISKKKHFPTLFEISMLRVVRCDMLLKLASERSLPRTIVSTMQRDIFKCFRCGEMNILPAYNSTDFLDYIDSVESLTYNNRNLSMTFMKLLCSGCFDKMSS